MKELFVYPIYGWGWKAGDDQYVPKPFHIYMNDEKKYIIKENDHEFNSLNIEFSQRHIGYYDFDQYIGDYNLKIFSDNKEVYITGYGYIGIEEKVLKCVIR